MNLRLIERRFQNLDAHANFVNYKYNPHTQKVQGISQHAYIEHLKEDFEADVKVFGQDPFYSKKVDSASLLKSKSTKIGNKIYENPKSSLFRDIDEKFELDEKRNKINQSFVTHKNITADDENSAADSKETNQRPHTTNFGQGQREFKIKRFGAATNAEKKDRYSFKATSIGRMFQSQRNLIQKKIKYYQKNTHYDWDNQQGLNSESNTENHHTVKDNQLNQNNSVAQIIKSSQAKFQFATSSNGPTQSQSKSNFLMNTSSRKPQDTIHKSQNLFDLAAQAEEKAIQQRLSMKNKQATSSFQNSLRAFEAQEQKPKVMFGEVSSKLKSFKSPVKDIPIKCQVQISKESILKKKKFDWIVQSLKSIKIPFQIIEKLQKTEENIQNMHNNYMKKKMNERSASKVEKDMNILSKLIETQRLIASEQINREKYNLSNHVPNSNELGANNIFQQRKKTFGEYIQNQKQVVVQNYKSGATSSSYDIIGSQASQKQKQKSVKINNLVMSSQNISKQKSQTKNLQKKEEAPAQVGISGHSSQPPSVRNHMRMISPNKMSPRFLAKNTQNSSIQRKPQTFGGSSEQGTPNQDKSFNTNQINLQNHLQTNLNYMQQPADQVYDQPQNQAQAQLQNHLSQNDRQSNLDSSQYQNQNKDSKNNLKRNEKIMGNNSNDMNYQSNIGSTFRELSPQSASANKRSQRISTQILSGNASFVKTTDQFYHNKDELTIQNQNESINNKIFSEKSLKENVFQPQQIIISQENQLEPATNKGSVRVTIEQKQDELKKISSQMNEHNISIVNKERQKVLPESFNINNLYKSEPNYKSSIFKKNTVTLQQNKLQTNKPSQSSQVDIQSNIDLLHDFAFQEKLNQSKQFIPSLKFVIKITDISELTNPFVVYDDIPVTQDGAIAIQHRYPQIQSLTAMLPWINHEHDIFRRTIKIEVLQRDLLIMQRYIHMDHLYPLEYPKIALQISYNLYQTQYLKYKQSKLQLLQEELLASQAENQKNSNVDLQNTLNKKQGDQGVNRNLNEKSTQKGRDEDPYNESELRMKSSSNANLFQRGLNFEEKFGLITQTMNFSTESFSKENLTNRVMQKQIQLQYQQEVGPIYVFDGATNILINQDESLLYYNVAKILPDKDQIIKNFGQNYIFNDLSTERNENFGQSTFEQIFYYMNPARDRNYKILKDLQLHKFHLKNIHEQIKSQEIMIGSGINHEDLIRFPKFQKNQQRILIEFQDCIIKSNDLIDFQILVDDNLLRANVLLDFEESLQPTLEKGVQGQHFSKDYNQMKSFSQLFKFKDNFSVVARQPQISKKEEEKNKYAKDFKQAVQTRGMDVLIRKNILKKVNENRKKQLQNQQKGNQDKITEKLLNDDTIVQAKVLQQKNQFNQSIINNEIINFSIQGKDHQDPFSFFSLPEYEFNDYKPILRSMVHVQQNYYDGQKVEGKFAMHKNMNQNEQIIIHDMHKENKIILPEGFDTHQIRSRSNLMVDTQTPSAYGVGSYINIQNNEQLDTEHGIHQIEFKRERDGADQISLQKTNLMNLKDGVITLLPYGQSQNSEQSVLQPKGEKSGLVTLKMGAYRNTLGFGKNLNQINEINTDLQKMQLTQENHSQHQNQHLNSLINQIGYAYKSTPNAEIARSTNNSIPKLKKSNQSPSSINLRSVISNSQTKKNVKTISPISKKEEITNKVYNKNNLHIQGNRINQISVNEKAKIPQIIDKNSGQTKKLNAASSQYSLLQLNKFNSASNSIGLNLNLESNQNDLNSIIKSAIFDRGKFQNGISQNINYSQQKYDYNVQKSSNAGSQNDNMSSSLYKNKIQGKKGGESNRIFKEDTVNEMVILPTGTQNIIRGQRSIIQEVELQQENQNSTEQLLIISRNNNQQYRD